MYADASVFWFVDKKSVWHGEVAHHQFLNSHFTLHIYSWMSWTGWSNKNYKYI